MSCGTQGGRYDCHIAYQVGSVTSARAAEIFALGQKIGLTEFNPTMVDWDSPVGWKGAGGGIMGQGWGWGMLILLGLGLTGVTLALTIAEQKFSGAAGATSEHFNTAGRSVKTGLTGAVIVSQWTWAATLLQSSNVAWQYGITGPFWYAAGATVQILLFGILGIEIKRRAPNAHTMLEMVKVRWGTTAHFVFLFFGLSANLIVSAMLLLGGCSVFKATAGISIYASSFIIPLLTLVYTLVGGLKATFLAGYVHTCVIMIVLVVFVTIVYGIEQDCDDTTKQCDTLGSASVVWERLTFLVNLPTRYGMSVTTPGGTMAPFHQGPANLGGKPNQGGTYLTIKSIDGFSFGIINIIGNFGTVFVDQSYWQSAIAAKPGAAHKGYILGGMVWFTIPFALATSLGLAGNALNVALTAGDAGSGLVPPAAAIALIGNTGGILIMVQLTMAILSTGSAECIAVSSLMSYDVYRTYINPEATGKQILMVSRVAICGWTLVMAIASIVLNEMDIGLGWVYNFMAIALGSAVCPIACAVWTDKLGPKFAILAAWAGMICAVVVWFIGAAGYGGGISVSTLGMLYAQLWGGLTALLSSLVICIIGCLVAPMNIDWNILLEGIQVVDAGTKVMADDDPDATPEALLKAKEWIWKYGNGYSFFLCVVWPLAAIPFGSFGKSTFQLWAAIALMWGWVAGGTIVIFPIYEALPSIMNLAGGKTSSPASKGVDTASA